MKIKSVITDGYKQSIDSYPCFKILDNAYHKNLIVLFTSETAGTVVHAESGAYAGRIGLHQTGWLTTEFKLFTGEVSLSNDIQV